MYPLYDVNQVTLGDDDVRGDCFLYPGPHAEDVTPPKNLIGGPCKTDADCPKAVLCLSGRCVRGAGEPGDPCEKDADCASRSCFAGGSCARSCATDGDCVTEQVCTAIDAQGAACSEGPSPGALGAPCANASDCAGGQCVAEQQRTFCSRTCDDTACPDGWTCTSVAQRDVCTPHVTGAGGGCRTANGSPSPTGAPLSLVTAGLAVLPGLRRLRRRRPATRPRSG